MNRSITSGFLSIFSARIVTSVLTIVSLPFIVRLLGPDGYGDYAFLMSTFSILMIFVSSGVTEGVQKFVGEARDVTFWREQVIAYYLKVALILVVVGSAAIVVAVELDVVTRLLGDRFDVYFYLLAAFVVAAQFRMFARRTLMGLGLERYSEPILIVYVIVWISTGLWLGYQGYGVAGFLGGHVVASTLVALLGFVIVFQNITVSAVINPVSTELPKRHLLSFNLLNIVLVLLVMSLYHVDVLTLRLLLGSEATGQYKAALAIAEYLWLVPLSLQSLLLHSTSNLWADEQHDRITKIAGRTTRYTLLFTALLALGLAALADRFVPLYFGGEFTGVIAPLLVLLPGTVAFSAARPIYAISQGKGTLKPLVLATGAASVVNLTLNMLLIPQFGTIGAGVATAVGYSLMFVLHVRSARHLGFDPLSDLRPGPLAVTVVVSAVAIFTLDALITVSVVSFVVIPVVGLAVYTATALLTGALDTEEIVELLSSCPPPIRNWTRAVQTHRSE